MLGLSRAHPLPASGGPPWPASTQEKLPRSQTAARGAVWEQLRWWPLASVRGWGAGPAVTF